jgi:hypothetical protein
MEIEQKILFYRLSAQWVELLDNTYLEDLLLGRGIKISITMMRYD